MSAATSAPAHQAMSPLAQIDLHHKPRRSVLAVLLNVIPNVIVFSLLGSVMYLGHHTGWKMPKLSALGGTPAAPVDDWCSEHLVPESQCIECNDALYKKPKSVGFCRIHGVAECVIHHPSLAQVKEKPTLPKYDTAKAIAVMTRPTNNSRDTLHTHRVQFT